MTCRLVAVACAAGSLLVACGRGQAERSAPEVTPSTEASAAATTTTAPRPETGSASAPSPCKLVTAATAAAVLGAAVKEPREETVSTGFVSGRRCLYLTAAPIAEAGGTGSLDLQVFDAASMAAADTLFRSPADYFEREYTAIKTTSGKVEDLPGIGDRAFWEPAGQMLHVLSHGIYLQVQIKDLVSLSASSREELDAKLAEHRRGLSVDLMRQHILGALKAR